MTSSVRSSHIFIIIVLVLLLLIVFLLKGVSNVDIEKPIASFPGTQREILKQNCNIETIYAVEDSQCEMICSQPGTFTSKNGACVNILAFSQDAVDNTCDPKKGVLAYLLGDPQFGRAKLLCLSVDIGVQPDNLSDPNTLCDGGTVEINYIDSFPQLAGCKCPAGKILGLIPNTSTIRQRGACISTNLYDVYNLNSLIYNKVY